MTENVKEKKKLKVPNVFALLMIVVIVCALLTYIIPAGAYDMAPNESGRNVAVPGSFHFIERTPVGPLEAFAAPFSGMIKAAEIVSMVFFCGGCFGVILKTGAINAALIRLALKMEGREILVVPILMFIFAFMGCATGMAEDRIIYIPVIMSLCLAMKYDSMTCAAIVILGANTGFTCSLINPYTIGVAQGIAELPLFSGMGLRSVMLVVMTIITTVYVMIYARRIRKNPQLSSMYEEDLLREGGGEDLQESLEKYPFNAGHKIILLAYLAIIAFMVYAGIALGGLAYTKICGLFFVLALVSAICDRISVDEFGKLFGQGMKDMAIGALVIGFARAILVVLESGQIIHTILFYTEGLLNGLPGVVCAEGMFLLQTIISFIISSGSGQAAITMPLLTPLADMVGVTRQTACLAYQLGDGISNAITPTSGNLMASIGMAGVPYEKWFKFVLPIIGIQYVIGIVFIAVAQIISYGPF